MHYRAYVASDPGRQRTENEDAFFVDEARCLFAVADGMGGHNAGEVASAIVVDEVARQAPWLERLLEDHCREQSQTTRQALLRFLPAVVEAANERVYQEALRDSTKRGMGSTAVVFVPAEEDAFIGHVGDSRVYLFRTGQLFRITEDHSLVMQLFKRGLLRAEELATHPRKNVILRSVGGQASVEVDTLYVDVYPGDRFVLCSDGLSDMVSEPDLAGLLAAHPGGEFVHAAVDAANAAGGRDNITVVLVEAAQDEDEALEQAPLAGASLGLAEKVDFLQDIFLFAQLTDQECVKVNRILYERKVRAGTPIVREGEYGEELYFVARGTVQVRRGDVHLVDIGPGGHFGELGMLGRDQRSASVLAREDTTLLFMRRVDFMQLLQDDPTLGNKVTWAFLANLADRVRDLSRRLAGH